MSKNKNVQDSNIAVITSDDFNEFLSAKDNDKRLKLLLEHSQKNTEAIMSKKIKNNTRKK